MDPLARNNVRTSGSPDGQTMLFVHGFGCDQNMWRFVAPAFEERFRVVLFDQVGAGDSDQSAYDVDKYSSLDGYATDIIEICEALDLRDVVLVGHSVSAMIGMLAALRAPDRFAKLVMVGPSPRYIDDDRYVGGFSEADIKELLESLDSNYLGWSTAMAPVIMGNSERPELGQELTESFCRADPAIAKRFAEVTFLSDNREDLARVAHPDPGAAVQQRRDRTERRGRLRPRADPRQHPRDAGGHRPLPEPQRTGGDDRCHPPVRGSLTACRVRFPHARRSRRRCSRTTPSCSTSALPVATSPRAPTA